MPFENEFEAYPPPDHYPRGVFRHMCPNSESLFSLHMTPSLKKIRIHYSFSTFHPPSSVFHQIFWLRVTTSSARTIFVLFSVYLYDLWRNYLQTISKQSKINPQNYLTTIYNQSTNDRKSISKQPQTNLKLISTQSRDFETISKQSQIKIKTVSNQSPNNLKLIPRQS